MKDLKLVVCSECMTVKVVLANTFGDTIFCAVCKKSVKSLDLENAEFYSPNLREWLKRKCENTN